MLVPDSLRRAVKLDQPTRRKIREQIWEIGNPTPITPKGGKEREIGGHRDLAGLVRMTSLRGLMGLRDLTILLGLPTHVACLPGPHTRVPSHDSI